MTKFEQVKNAVSNSIRFLSSKRDSILTLMLMLVWTCLLFLFNTPDHQSGMESQVQIICNDKSYINHPMASKEKITSKQAMLILGPIFTCLSFVIIAILHGIAGRTKNTNFSKWKFFYRSLLWILYYWLESFSPGCGVAIVFIPKQDWLQTSWPPADHSICLAVPTVLFGWSVQHLLKFGCRPYPIRCTHKRQ